MHLQAPEKFSSWALDNQSIEFNWVLPDQNLTGLSVRLRVWTNNTMHTAELYPLNNTTRGVVAGLHPLTEYKMNFSVHNFAQNLSDTCVKINEDTTFPTPPIISIVEVWEDSIAVKVEPMQNGEMDGAQYRVTARSAYDGSPRYCSIWSSEHNFMCTLSKLQPLTVYTITAMADHDGLYSLDSLPIKEKTPGILDFEVYPGAPWEMEARWYAEWLYNSSYEFRIIVNGTLDSTCKQPMKTGHHNCTMKGYAPGLRYPVQLVACLLNESHTTSCRRLSCGKELALWPEGHFEVHAGGPRVINTYWHSPYAYNSSFEYRVTVNGNLDTKCKQTATTQSFKCKTNNHTPNSNYSVQMVICRPNALDRSNCKKISNETSVCLPPEAPSTISAVAVDSRSIKVAFEIPTQTMNGLRSAVVVAVNNSYRLSETNATSDTKSGFVGGLSPLTEYNTQLCVSNYDCNIPTSCSQRIKVQTLPNAPGLNMTVVGVEFISVGFVPKQTGELVNLTYNASATDLIGGEYNCSTKANNEQLSCTFENLKTLTNYSITAATCLGAQCSEESPVYTVKTLGVEDFTVHAIGPREIEAAWHSPYRYDSSREFRIIKNETLDNTCKQPLNNTFCNCTMKDFDPNSQYLLQLAVCKLNENNLQRCEKLLHPQFIYLPPVAPDTFSATAVDNQSINFTWNIPDQTTAGLDVHICVQSRCKTYPAKEANTGVIGGLLPLTEYTANLSIHNEQYNYSVPSNGTQTVLTFPNAPTFTTTIVGTAINVTFEPMQDGEWFTVAYKAVATGVDGSQRSCSAKASEGKVSCAISELKNYTVYMVTATACVPSKCSAQSTAILVQTQKRAETM